MPPPTPDGGAAGALAEPLLATLPWGVLLLSAPGTVLYLNPQAAAWWGVSSAAAQGQPLTQVGRGTLPEPLYAALTQLAAGEPQPANEYYLPAADQWLAMASQNIPKGIAVHWQDITAQKQREYQYEALANNTPDALSRWNPQLQLVYANPAFTAQTGRLPAGLGHPAAVAEPWLAKLRQVLATGQPQELLDTWPTLTGEEQYHTRFVPELRHGQLATVLAITRNTTAQWHSQQVAQEALRLKEELAQRASDQYQRLFNSLDEAFGLLEVLFDDAQQPYDCRLLAANPEFCRQLGQADVADKTLREVLPDLEPYWFDACGRVALTGESVRTEWYVAPLGRWLDIHAFRTGSAAAPQVAVLASDSTARKQAETALQVRGAQQAFLVRLADALRPLIDPSQVQAAAVRLLGEHLGVDRAFYSEISGKPGAEYYQVEHVYHAPDFEFAASRYPLRPFGRWVAESQAGRNIVVADLETDPLLDEAERVRYRALHLRAWVGIPVRRQGRSVALLVVHAAQVRAWTPAEISLLEELAELIWTTVARARAEVALRQSEEKYRLLFETINEGFGIAEVLFAKPQERPLDVRWLEANPQLEQLLGQPRAELLGGRTVRQLWPELEESWFAHYAQVAGQGKPARFEQYAPALGRWFEVYVFRLGGKLPWRVAALFRDITDQRVAAQQLQEFNSLLEHQVAERTQALRESRDLLHAVAETQTAGLRAFRALRNEEGQLVDLECIFANTLAEQRAGGPPLVGRRYLAALAAGESPDLLAVYHRVIDTGELDEREVVYTDGAHQSWFRSIATRLGDGLLVSNEDITARKLASQERTKALRLLEQSEEVARMGSWDYELATGHITWSAGMYHLFELEPGSPPMPPPYLDFVVAEDRPIAERLGRSLLAGAGAFEEMLRLQIGDDVKTVCVKAALLTDEDGQPRRILGVDMDISNVQRLEAENLALRLDQQQTMLLAILQAQETERNRLAESLHNGLGQLLYAIKLQISQLDVPVLHALPNLNGVRSHVNQLLSMAIKQTRTLAHELMPTLLNEQGLGPALRDICRSLSTPQLQFACHVWLDEQVLSPPLQTALYRLAQELAHNIAKHAGASQAALEFEVLPGWVSLRAEDNGRGFDPAATARGLGLRLLHDAVGLLGGTITLDSSPDYGTHIRLRIPLPLEKAS
ncbi:MAG: PAS domain-containing protein [Janthinobacterium lividum]